MLFNKKNKILAAVMSVVMSAVLVAGCTPQSTTQSGNSGSSQSVSRTQEKKTSTKKKHKPAKRSSVDNSTDNMDIETLGKTDTSGYNMNNNKDFRKFAENMYSKGEIPAYRHKPSIRLNNNKPFFSFRPFKKVYKNYSDLDSMNRVGPCEVVTGPEYLPKAKRGEIDKVHPTGWKQKKYSFVDGGYLYNRCHLIGYQIAGDNDNWKNLMTGTRYMNVDGMLPFENDVADYIKRTGHHVKYRVTPVFTGSDKVARGVIMEARSLEDNKLNFNVFCYNVQPGVKINYSDGSSRLDKKQQ